MTDFKALVESEPDGEERLAAMEPFARGAAYLMHVFEPHMVGIAAHLGYKGVSERSAWNAVHSWVLYRGTENPLEMLRILYVSAVSVAGGEGSVLELDVLADIVGDDFYQKIDDVELLCRLDDVFSAFPLAFVQAMTEVTDGYWEGLPVEVPRARELLGVSRQRVHQMLDSGELTRETIEADFSWERDRPGVGFTSLYHAVARRLAKYPDDERLVEAKAYLESVGFWVPAWIDPSWRERAV